MIFRAASKLQGAGGCRLLSLVGITTQCSRVVLIVWFPTHGRNLDIPDLILDLDDFFSHSLRH